MTALGQRLSALVRSGDHLARIATTEFAVLCERVHDPEPGLALAERFLHASQEPFLLADGEVHLPRTSASPWRVTPTTIWPG